MFRHFPIPSILLWAVAVPSVLALSTACSPTATPTRNGVNLNRDQKEQRLSFQAHGPWNPRVNLNSDIAMVYGVDKSLPQRLKTWKDKGYLPHVMTGVAWGEYQDYIYGRWDGKDHHDEIQTEPSGRRIGHGGDVWYMTPTENYTRYLIEGVKRALDAGAEAIYLEEPEYWVRAGWEEAFKREWQAYYGEPWISPEASPDAQWKASKLKYYLYRRALSTIFNYVREYGKQHNREIRCYVPTHSTINYAVFGICSPESSLIDVGCDGYIAQVWTGTARSPNHYEGVRKERTFETAFLEYGSMQNLVRASGRTMWFLNDPIEDNPNHSWYDYRTNWRSTLIASLLQPEVYRYEIMPWPHRIFQRSYPSTQPVRRDTPRIPIPKDYETELQSVISALGDMKQPKYQWLASGTRQVGILFSDTLMFQQWGPDTADHDLGHFFGLAFPLLMRGMPIEPVQIETADLSPYKVLLLSYEGQKPPKPDLHAALKKWVNAGGTLIVVDNDKDPFNTVREWWNTGENHFKAPRHHLFKSLGLSPDATGLTRVGKGVVFFESRSPTQISRDPKGAERIRQIAIEAMAAANIPWQVSNALVLRRGPYIVAAGLESPVPGSTPFKLQGNYLNLFDARLGVQTSIDILPGDRYLLVDLDANPGTGILAAACRVQKQEQASDSISFVADGIESSNAIVCLRVPKPPKAISLDNTPLSPASYRYKDSLLWIEFENHVSPRSVRINW